MKSTKILIYVTISLYISIILHNTSVFNFGHFYIINLMAKIITTSAKIIGVVFLLITVEFGSRINGKEWGRVNVHGMIFKAFLRGILLIK